MSDVMIEAQGLTKRYDGVLAIDRVSMEVRRGEVLGFLGPNGAGKSTTMKMLTCFLSPTAGTAKVAGYDVFDDSLEVRRRIGYLPEDTPIYRDMTVLEYLQFVAEMRGMDSAKSPARIKEIGGRCGLGDVAGKLVGELSKGYRQRLGLAQAMLNDPDILILDEPTSALDSESEEYIQKALESMRHRKTLIVIAHRLSTVSHSDQIVVLDHGVIVERGVHEQLLDAEGAYHRLFDLQIYR